MIIFLFVLWSMVLSGSLQVFFTLYTCFILRYLARPRFTNQHKPSQSVLESKNAQLLCPVSSGFPTPRVEWQRRIQKSFKPIPESPRFLASLNGSLTILNVTAEDETDYSCIACNPNTYKESRTTKLNVNGTFL